MGKFWVFLLFRISPYNKPARQNANELLPKSKIFREISKAVSLFFKSNDYDYWVTKIEQDLFSPAASIIDPRSTHCPSNRLKTFLVLFII